jgi:hypothetical protein
MSAKLLAEHVGGCNRACVSGDHFIHGKAPDVIQIQDSFYRAGSTGYELALLLIRAQAERDDLADRLTPTEAAS